MGAFDNIVGASQIQTFQNTKDIAPLLATLVLEQARTNELLEALIRAQGGEVPARPEPVMPEKKSRWRR